eukprot:COSAG01_NODE_373_length_17991_cov_284.890075_14_plen_45_part_00
MELAADALLRVEDRRAGGAALGHLHITDINEPMRTTVLWLWCAA